VNGAGRGRLGLMFGSGECDSRAGSARLPQRNPGRRAGRDGLMVEGTGRTATGPIKPRRIRQCGASPPWRARYPAISDAGRPSPLGSSRDAPDS
jgi:hypothetical protein